MSQNQNPVASRNDALVLLYIEHAHNNLAAALPKLDCFGVRDMTKAFALIQDVIIDGDWNNYLNSSTALTADEIFAVKLWFNNVTKVRKFIEQQSSTDTQAELQSTIRRILNDPDLKAVREKLIAATNHAKELNT